MRILMEATMTNTFMNWTSRVAIARRVAEQSHPHILPGDYHLPFGKVQARTEATKWIWQI
jgi:hypothetical protein